MQLSGEITMDRTEAQERADELNAHPKQLTDDERSFLSGYRALAEGRHVVNLVDVITGGGCFDDRTKLPRLAVARPYDRWVYIGRAFGGSVTFASSGNVNSWRLNLPDETLPRLQPDDHATYLSSWSRIRALVPPVPLGIRLRLSRPRTGGFRSCLTLFEVDEWAAAPAPPGDPALLRPLGGWLYSVEATWDLTPLERTVLGARRLEP